MLFIFSTPVLIGHMWQFKTVVFQHRCLIRAVLKLSLPYAFSTTKCRSCKRVFTFLFFSAAVLTANKATMKRMRSAAMCQTNWGQCYKTFTAVSYHHSMVITSFCVIELYYLGNYNGMAVNYQCILTLEEVRLKLPL
jgi:hypothetical protein